MSQHGYNISTDFAATSTIALNKLKEEIAAAGLATPAGIVVDYGGDLVTFTFDPDLTGGEETTLDGVVAVHDGIEKVLRMETHVHRVVADKHFHDVNYKTELDIKLQARRTFVKGELRKVEWFESFDGTDFTGRVLDCDMVYVRDSNNFAISRTTTRTWYHNDDTKHPNTKVTEKWYANASDRIQEGTRRRSTNIDILVNNVLGMIYEARLPESLESSMEVGRDFMNKYSVEISSFVREAHTAFATAVTGATDTWLDFNPTALGGSTSIRTYILGELA